MSSRVKSRPPWQGVGTGAKDAKALKNRPAWQGTGTGRKAPERSSSPVKPRVVTKRPSQSPARVTSEYNRSHTLHAYGSDTVSSSTGTGETSVLTGSTDQSSEDAPAPPAKKEPARTGRARSTVAPKTPVQRTPAPRKPAARTSTVAARTPAPRTPAPRTPEPTKPSTKPAFRSNDPNRVPKRRGASRVAPRQSSIRTKDKDGWEADSEDSFTVVGVEPKPCVWSGTKETDEVLSCAPCGCSAPRLRLAMPTSPFTREHAYSSAHPILHSPRLAQHTIALPCNHNTHPQIHPESSVLPAVQFPLAFQKHCPR